MTHYDKGYLYKVGSGRTRIKYGQVDKSIFTIVACEGNTKKIRGFICCSKNIYFPESFIGKRIRLKVEEVDDN
jgi:hypothetical protein